MLHFGERCSTVFPFSMELIVFKKSLRKNKLLAQNSPTNIAIWRQNSNIIIVKVKYFCVCVLTISFSIFIFGPKFGKHFYIFLRRTLWSLWEKNELFLRKQILSFDLPTWKSITWERYYVIIDSTSSEKFSNSL